MDTNEINKNGNKTIRFIIISILIIVVISLVGFTFARYITQLNGNTEAKIARWNFNVTAGSSQNLDIDLSQTRFENDTQEVDRTKVAPGTSGALVLNVNATNTQVSLKYDIDIDLTEIPENLIFYSDSNMTNAMYKENEIIHLEGYFDQGTNNKTEAITLYWQWPIETGSTQNEIDANDLLDSNWIGAQPEISISVTGRQIMQEQETNKYAVTFDANGGTLQGYGNSSQATKMVTYGETYGALPEPTREGYTFMGWNGKNLINKSKSRKAGIRNETAFSPFADTIFNNEWIISNLEPNKQYTISYDIECISVPEYDVEHSSNLGIFLNCNNGYKGVWLMAEKFIEEGEKIHYEKSFTTPEYVNLPEAGYIFSCYSNRYVKDSVGVISTIILSNLQLEKGDVATTYEPYYLTSSTPVSQNKNHTLTAIWEPNP